jgi:hypothetical protein
MSPSVGLRPLPDGECSGNGKRRMPLRRRNLSRLLRRFAAGLIIFLSLVGCRSNKHYDGIEAELRTRNRELAEAQKELERTRAINRAYEQSRGAIPGAEPIPLVPGAGCSIREIALGRGTGGVDDDAIPGDEYLMVVIIPTDEDKSPIKVPARAAIGAWEFGPDGLKRGIGMWEIAPEQLRSTWKSGLLATGYFVPLQWQNYPTTARVRVAVRLTTVDGRMYEADRDISVRPMMPAMPALPVLPPAPDRQPLLPGTPPPGVPPVLPPGYEELPPPTGVDPRRGAQLLPPAPR